jgi:hypothetical protein
MREPLKWFDANATDNPTCIKGHMAPRASRAESLLKYSS